MVHGQTSYRIFQVVKFLFPSHIYQFYHGTLKSRKYQCRKISIRCMKHLNLWHVLPGSINLHFSALNKLMFIKQTEKQVEWVKLTMTSDCSRAEHAETDTYIRYINLQSKLFLFQPFYFISFLPLPQSSWFVRLAVMKWQGVEQLAFDTINEQLLCVFEV